MRLVSTGFLALVLVIATVAVLSPKVQATSVSLTLVYHYSGGWTSPSAPGFNPTLGVHPGDTVNLTLENPDGVIANFAIYPEGTPPDQVIQGSPAALVRSGFLTGDRSSLTIAFSIQASGSYEYYSEVFPSGAHGIFNVLPEGTVVPALGAIDAPLGALTEEEVHFSVTATDANGDALSALWSFTDGGIANGSTGTGGGPLTVGHLYAFSDRYAQATVLVDDGRGGRASVTSPTVDVDCCGWLVLNTTPAVPGTIFLDGIWRDDWSLQEMKIASGLHEASFSDVPGYATPAPYELYVVGLYPYFFTPALGGYQMLGHLNVTIDPPLPATVSVDGIPRNDWGANLDLTPGIHTVSYGAVAGYAAPPNAVVTVVAGESRTVVGTYSRDPTAPGPDPATFGTLRVTSDPPVNTTISVDGVPRAEWGLNWLKLPPGTYTVSFSGLPGFLPPPAVTVLVQAGQTTEVRGAFTQLGYLRVMMDPWQAVSIFVDGTPRDDNGVWTAVLPGTYTIRFGSVGHTASTWSPPDATVTVVAGRTTLVVGHTDSTDVSTY